MPNSKERLYRGYKKLDETVDEERDHWTPLAIQKKASTAEGTEY